MLDLTPMGNLTNVQVGQVYKVNTDRQRVWLSSTITITSTEEYYFTCAEKVSEWDYALLVGFYTLEEK